MAWNIFSKNPFIYKWIFWKNVLRRNNKYLLSSAEWQKMTEFYLQKIPPNSSMLLMVLSYYWFKFCLVPNSPHLVKIGWTWIMVQLLIFPVITDMMFYNFICHHLGHHCHPSQATNSWSSNLAWHPITYLVLEWDDECRSSPFTRDWGERFKIKTTKRQLKNLLKTTTKW